MAEPLLAIEGVDAYYGRARALEEVSFEIAGGATSIVGRNGMGKTTLCNAIVGLPPARVTGSIRFRGKELVGLPSYKVAKLGIPLEIGRRRLGEDRPGDHDELALGDRRCDTEVLLDQQDREAFSLELLERLDEVLDDRRRKPLGGLVHDQERRVREQRARDREHLLLATGELRASVPFAFS